MTEQLQNSSGLPMNSRKYWDFRFEHTWETDGGREQTRYLYELLISALPDSIVQKLTTKPQSLLDWGCALGDGLARLVERFPLLVGTGCDHSLAAIEKARKSFPKLTFTDNAPRESAERYDIVLTSNTLGHFADPWKYAEELAASARDLLIIFVPFHDTQKEHETEYQFTATTIPL